MSFALFGLAPENAKCWPWLDQSLGNTREPYFHNVSISPAPRAFVAITFVPLREEKAICWPSGDHVAYQPSPPEVTRLRAPRARSIRQRSPLPPSLMATNASSPRGDNRSPMYLRRFTDGTKWRRHRGPNHCSRKRVPPVPYSTVPLFETDTLVRFVAADEAMSSVSAMVTRVPVSCADAGSKSWATSVSRTTWSRYPRLRRAVSGEVHGLGLPSRHSLRGAGLIERRQVCARGSLRSHSRGAYDHQAGTWAIDEYSVGRAAL